MSLRFASLVVVLLASSVACSGAGDGATAGATDGAGASGAGASGSTGTGAGHATSTGSGANTSTGTAGDGGGGGGATTPAAALSLPNVVALPYVVAGAGGTTAAVTLHNAGDLAATDLVWTLSGDPALTITSTPPTEIDAHADATITLAYAGAASESIASASLSVASSAPAVAAHVYAVAGDPNLGAATWETITGAGGVTCGEGATVAMPTAPFPDGSGQWDDPSVHVFLPADYRDRGAQDLVVHFHGWGTTIADTMATKLFREQLYLSGSNAVLVVPQGPVNADSGDFGKLMQPGGLAAMTREVLVLLYREQRITAPLLDELVLTSHSGGYEAVAYNLGSSSGAPPVAQVDMFDSMYGYLSTFEGFVTAGGLMRTNYTSGGGTDGYNEQYASDLMGAGVTVETTPTLPALRDAKAVVYFADSSHDDSTRLYAAYAEELRWGLHHGRKGPRIDVRELEAVGANAHVRWLAPNDADVTGFDVQTSTDGTNFTTVTTAPASASDATFPLTSGARVRVVPVVPGIADAQPSDVYRVDPGATTLVVDGFDRQLDGAYGGLTHAFAADVGEATGRPVATIARRALAEDGFDLGPYSAVVWIMGDQSTMDITLAASDQAALAQYVSGGGHLVITGSELGYDLSPSSGGASFLSSVLGATYREDASGSYDVASAPALGASLSFTFGGATSAYHVDYPDVYEAGSGEALTYGNGLVAGVGVAGKSAVVGFPLETIDAKADLRSAMRALMAFVGAP
ncbi:MAG TPA: hypothetical protein VGM56_19905 [Byssovorax sp.]|jgi:hypothetical protein